jgi:hypothetical protein
LSHASSSPPPWPGRPDSWLFLFAGSRYTWLIQHW